MSLGFYSSGNLHDCSFVEGIEAVTKASDHIAFSRNIIPKHSVSPQREKLFCEQLHFIEERFNGSTLYLAVLGEFSSGKSTFINALLRQRLLKSARVATTASATYIKSGNFFQVSATFLDGKCIQATESDVEKLYQAIDQLKKGIQSQLSLKDLLDLLTSDQDVADWVNRIEISLPEDKLKSGLSIIDTPGIGAGSDYTKDHEGVTRKVIEESADAAIVLIPSSQPMSSTLISFLRTTASHILHRCIFVVTAMDDQEDEQRRNIIDFVRQKLREKLGLIDPIVFESAAITMLPISVIPLYKKDVWAYWQNQFIELEKNLFSEIIRQRSIIISERLVFLFQSIFVELNKDINEKQGNLADEARFLNKNSVLAIEEVLKNIFEEGSKKIYRQGNRFRANVSSKRGGFCYETKSSISNVVNGASWEKIKNYDKALEPEIREAVELRGRSFANEFIHDLEEFEECCEEVCEEFRSQFELNYRNLKSLGLNIAVPSLALTSLSVSSIRFNSPKYYIEQINQEDNQRAKGGAALGGTIGLFVAGPLGALVGATVGGFFGYAINDIDTCRKEILNRVEKDINSYIDEYISEINSTVSGFVNDAISMVRTDLGG
jgi:predicted GTPase